MSAEPIYADPVLDFRVRNDAFTYKVTALSEAAQREFGEFRPDIERERDGRLGLCADELAEFEAWARGRGLSFFTYMSE